MSYNNLHMIKELCQHMLFTVIGKMSQNKSLRAFDLGLNDLWNSNLHEGINYLSRTYSPL